MSSQCLELLASDITPIAESYGQLYTVRDRQLATLMGWWTLFNLPLWGTRHGFRYGLRLTAIPYIIIASR